MYKSERYELTTEDNLYEKLDAKIGNVLLRSEELAEIKHQVKVEKQRAKYYKAKAKAEAAKRNYENRSFSVAESRAKTEYRVIDI